ncbi:hypothetical protein CR513_47127, partial [Mucuna pruriens]
MVQAQFSSQLKAVQTDQGGEYRPFSTYLVDLGIQHRLTCPHTSIKMVQLKGSTNRFLKQDRQIVKMGLTLLTHASIPYKYWDHSFTQAIYLINRIRTTSLPTFTSPSMLSIMSCVITRSFELLVMAFKEGVSKGMTSSKDRLHPKRGVSKGRQHPKEGPRSKEGQHPKKVTSKGKTSSKIDKIL